jgi:hypothetical protein
VGQALHMEAPHLPNKDTAARRLEVLAAPLQWVLVDAADLHLGAFLLLSKDSGGALLTQEVFLSTRQEDEEGEAGGAGKGGFAQPLRTRGSITQGKASDFCFFPVPEPVTNFLSCQ